MNAPENPKHRNDNGPRLFGPVTDADRRIWQIRAHAALATVLGRAHTAGLVPLVWTIGQTGQLAGRVPTIGLSHKQIREIFTAWAEFVGLSTRREHRSSEGVHLTALGDVPDGTGRLGRPIGITAHLDPDDDPAGVDPTTEECGP